MSEAIEENALIGNVSIARILVVDDMALMRQMIGMCLKKGGFNNVHYAEDGDEALEVIAADKPDIIILDLNMPRMSGFEVCQRLRENPETASLPILVQSASETPEERTRVFDAGATDFVSKPINQPEMIARVRMHLENKFLITNLADFHSNMQNELSQARDMQEALLPRPELIESIATDLSLGIESFYKASFELGGDLWGCWQLPGDKLGFYVLDVSGHGVRAALNTFTIHATMERFVDEKLDPAVFLRKLNQELIGSFPTGQFATMFYAVLDVASRKLTYSGAGAPRPLVIGKDGITSLNSEGIPVAIIKSADYDTHEHQLEEGDTVFCYSDVLIETELKDKGMLGEEGLIKFVERCQSRQLKGEKIATTILRRFSKIAPASLPDDLTAVGVYV